MNSPGTIEDPLQAQRWEMILQRRPATDGFVYGVTTTGVFCRPDCPARRPLRAHVRMFSSPEEAAAQGFRACRRCRPGQLSGQDGAAALVERACRIMEAGEEIPSLAILARQLGVSGSKLHRTFRETTGLTPAAYGRALRARRVREALGEGRAVTESLYAAGFGASGRFYAAAPHILGMSPHAFRSGGAGEVLTYDLAPCALGWVLGALSQRGVCAILLGDAPEVLEADLRSRFPNATLERASPGLAAAMGAIVDLVEAPETDLGLPLDIRGTVFQQKVWQALSTIPPGRTATYEEIAARLGAPRAHRAVAGACAANPLAVAIPCHRVVRKTGALGGYRWGLSRKEALLERERRKADPDEAKS